MVKFRFIILGIFCLLTVASPGPRFASAADAPSAPDSKPEDVPIELTADEVSNDQNLGIVTARGNVEISKDGRTLIADTVTYNRKADIMTASGNITLLEPSGDTMFAQYMELSGDMKDGIIESLSILLKDHSRIAANGGRRSNANILEMSKAVYSPCKPCEDDPNKAPLWQVKAVKIVHNQARQSVEYSDAVLEIAGVPVAYTPYLSHPDPTVKRRSGFLTPGIGGSSDLGFVVRTPYFFALDEHKDLTLTPMIAANEGPTMIGEYRNLMNKGELKGKASVTYDSNHDMIGHIAGKGRFNIDDSLRWGFDANRMVGDRYLHRYGFISDNTLPGSTNSLTTNLFTEGFRKRNYASFNAYTFQGLKDGDTRGVKPYVLPMLNYSHAGEPGRLGGRTNLDVSLLALSRTAGADSRRLSVGAGWQAPYLGPLGDSYKLSASLRGDAYHANQLLREDTKREYSGASGRVLPEVRLDWSYPFIKRDGASSYQIIEPVMSAIASPYGGNSTRIPNEDSLNFEFDDTNLFSSSRYSGIDRVESGPRINYGLKWGVYGKGGGSTSLLVGQSYRVKNDDSMPLDSGMDAHLSDFVAKVQISPASYMNLLYRTRFDKDNLKVRRNELSVTAGVPAFNINTDYVFFDHQRDGQFSGREEVSFGVNSKFNRLWKGSANMVRDQTGEGLRSVGLNLTYEDECFLLASDLSRSFFRDRDLRPNNAIMFRAMFKTLGEVTSGITKSQ